MAKRFQKAKGDVTDLIEEVLGQHHGELVEHRVTVGCLLAFDAFNGLKLHGYPCAATVKITPYERRVQGIEDAVITLDGYGWGSLSHEARVALIDHELYHLTLARSRKTGEVQYDDLGRPKLKMRLHDVQLGVFDAIIRRHGEHAIDTRNVRACFERYRQSAFAWGDDNAPADGPPPSIAEALVDAIAELAPEEGSGVDSITLSVGDKSVALTPEVRKRLKGAKARA